MSVEDENNKAPQGSLAETPAPAYAETAGVISAQYPDDAEKARLDKWLADLLPHLTRTRIKTLIETGYLSLNGTVAKTPATKVKAGDEIEITVPPAEAMTIEPEQIPLDILFEDDDLIVLVKPAGLVVHPGAGNWSGTLVNALLFHCRDSLSGIGGVARPGIVHRLDKDTSGVMVVAKSDRAHQGLAEQFSQHTIERAYLALVMGSPRPGFGTIDKALRRAPNDRKKITIARDGDLPGARRAVTHYKLLESFGTARGKLPGEALASLVECRLETGRTHQIRVHMNHLGHPLIGDQTYGRGPGLAGLKPGEAVTEHAIETIRNFKRQALHAAILGFTHPITGEMHRFERGAPADFQALLAALQAL